ncbi:hypothetical protein CPT_Muldoon_064 [Serratia phage Muldoon]|uniref:Uncharacterized protein n=1 Tax=Serratia phage Muldoon TaxID=2601678 RepID=A0A5P8PIZ3_9CAUD|nr:hypothetical protein HYP94_gp063 [Serratia phage Muldoon]QFR56020.1 hypothetical protein CPT_Muldoon_064 [Serratia phage Muldoon]
MIEIPQTVIVSRRCDHPDRISGIYTTFEDLNWKLTDLNIVSRKLNIEFRLYPVSDSAADLPPVTEMFEEGMTPEEYMEYIND